MRVYAFPQHRKLRCSQSRRAIGRRRPWKTTAPQNLLKHAKIQTVPKQQLDPVPAAAAEGEHGAKPGSGAGSPGPLAKCAK